VQQKVRLSPPVKASPKRASFNQRRAAKLTLGASRISLFGNAVDAVQASIEGALAPGQFLLFGSIGRAMTTLFLTASGMAILRGRIMPSWFGRLALVLALINVAFLPAMFFGSDAAQFYSAVGWGTTATIPALVVCWILVASITLVRR